MSWTPDPDCPECTAWAENWRHGAYRMGCRDCALRSIANGPDADRAARGITSTGLVDAVERVFGAGSFERYRSAVWTWMKRIKEARACKG